MTEDVRHRVLLDLAKRVDTRLRPTMAAVTEGSAAVLDVGRVSVWRFVNDRTEIVCDDLFVRDQNRHDSGATLLALDHSTYFGALLKHRMIVADSVRDDPRTVELNADYLIPLGITSMLDVPIWHRGGLYGILCHEHVGPLRAWSPDEIDFAGNLADVVSASLEASERRAFEERWRILVENIAEGVLIFRSNGDFELMNPVMSSLVAQAGGGVTLAEREQLLDYVDVDGRPIQRENWPGRRALRGEIIPGEIVGVNFQRTGERRYFRMTGAPLPSDVSPDSCVVVVSDVTEEMNFERLKRDFLGAAAHELKTPVAVIKGFAQLLTKTGDQPDSRAEGLAAIQRSAERMERVIRDLVDLSTITLGRLSLTREQADLGALVHTVAEYFARTSRRHTFSVEAPLPVVAHIDVSRTEHALRQIVDNAVRFSPAGTPIEIRLWRDGCDAVISVRDHGVGIPAEQRSHIFDGFYRAHADTEQDRGGLGVGLFLAREIVTRQGGRIEFESREGEGTMFLVRLPVVESL